MRCGNRLRNSRASIGLSAHACNENLMRSMRPSAHPFHDSPLRTADATLTVGIQRQIRLAKPIAPKLSLQPRWLHRIWANRLSKAFPIRSPAAGRAKARKQDAKPGVLQSSPTTVGHHFVPKNIEGQNLLVRGPHHRFRQNFATETASRPSATAKDRCADRKARDSFRG